MESGPNVISALITVDAKVTEPLGQRSLPPITVSMLSYLKDMRLSYKNNPPRRTVTLVVATASHARGTDTET